MPVSERTLLHEGREGAILPSVAYCRQGANVWFAYGSSSSCLDESVSGLTVVESFEGLDLEEREVNGKKVKLPKDGVWVLEGPAQQ